MTRLICFDLDGTLIDSAADIAVAANRTLTEYGKPKLPYEVVKSHIGEGVRSLLKQTFPDMTDTKEQDILVRRFSENYEEEMLVKTSVFPGAEDFLKDWTAQGGLIGLITNKNEAPSLKIMQHLGLLELPWVGLFGADTLAERKPSPLPLRTMMEKAGVTVAETVMIGDGIPDMESANAAGVDIVALNFGYTDPKILATFKPWAFLDHYRDLKTLLATRPC